MSKKQTVRLSAAQRRHLLRIVKTGQRKAREILHAHILLKCAEGWTDPQIAQAFDVGLNTVARTRIRYVQCGVSAALQEQARSGKPPNLTLEQETLLIALACSPPPPGRRRWTVRLLAAHAVQRQIVTRITAETVRPVLKKIKSNPGDSKVGARLNSRLNFWHV
jgi:transposase